MKLVYTNENRLLVGNAENILQANGVNVVWKNQFNQGAIGETSPTDAWPQLWVVNDADYARACELLENALSGKDAPEWTCPNCGERNDTSFEICWQCRSEPA